MTPLLARAGSADRQFERMYQRYVGDVYRYSLAVLRNAQDAEDVTQTTFLNALRAMQNGERPESPKNWLIAIAHNVCRQRFRQAQRRPQESPFFEDAAEAAVPESDERYSAEDIQRALGQLAFNQRAALVMRELEGRSYAEIAEIMGITLAAVETVLFRARRALREQLEGSLSCAEAEFFLSKQTDGELARAERAQLRAHLRECQECETLARQQRASRGALKALLGGMPLPASLWGGSGLTFGLGAKAAAVVCAGAVVGTGGYEASKQIHVKPVAAASSAAARTHEPGSAKPNQARASRPANPVALAAAAAAASKPAQPKPGPAKARTKANPAAKRHERSAPPTHTRPTHTVPPTASPRAQTNAAAPKAKATHPAHPATPAHPVAQPHSTKPETKKPAPPTAHVTPTKTAPKPERPVKANPKADADPAVPAFVETLDRAVDEALHPGQAKAKK
jgi:RNA polymerase sigma factor (sigma-70 family)